MSSRAARTGAWLFLSSQNSGAAKTDCDIAAVTARAETSPGKGAILTYNRCSWYSSLLEISFDIKFLFIVELQRSETCNL